MTDKTKFRPVTGTDAQIEMAPKVPGWVYFAEDTGKIYYDIDTETRITMGGSGVAIHYGIAAAGLLPNPDFADGTYYILTSEDLQNTEVIVAVDDLIFNSDGTFYRVSIIEGQNIYCQKVAVAGGGGGGGSSTGVSKVANLKLAAPKTVNLINGQDISITLTATSQVSSDGTIEDEVLTVTWSLAEKVGNNYVTYHNGTSFMVEHGVPTELSFGEHLRPSTTSRITIQASGINSGETPTRAQDFTSSELTLTESRDFTSLAIYDVNNLIVWSNVSGNMNKIVDYYFDDELIHTERLGPTSETAQKYQIPTNLCTHGYHTVRIELFQAVGTTLANAERALSVAPLEFEVAVRQAGQTTPIIWLGGYQKQYYNYDDIKIPYAVYDPESAETTKVYLWKSGLPTASPEREVPSSTYTKWNEFEIVDASMDLVNYYSISCGSGEREVRRDITFTVVQDPIRKMEVVKQDYLQLSFDAKGRSNAESATSRSTWTYARKDKEDVTAHFDNFNWYNNGWVPDETGNSCLRISNGAQFRLPIGSTTFASGTMAEQSHTFEFQFKVRNVQDYTELIENITRYVGDTKFYEAFTDPAQTNYTNYDAFLQYYLPIYPLGPEETEADRKKYDDLEFEKVQKNISLDKITCGYYSGNEQSATGFCLGTQDAFFSNGNNTVSVSYVEDKMVYLSIVYDHGTDAASRRIYIYINGMLTGAIKSTETSSFTINADELVFSSNYCDIDLYKIRIYNTALSVNDIVMNYAVDTKDVDTYDLNGLALENTALGEYQFNFQKMLDYNKANPSKYIMPYIVFDTTNTKNEDRLPWSKQVEIPVAVTFKNTGLDHAYATGELVEKAIKDGLCNKGDDAAVLEAAVKEYYRHHCPSWTGDYVEMVVQGTSSEFYPRRNYKIKMKNNWHDKNDEDDRINIFMNAGPFENDFIVHGTNYPSGDYENPCHSEWFYMDNYDVGTNRFTMKIDYMESSGSYNGGFANLVYNAYSKHPLDDYIGKGLIIDDGGLLNTASLRTSVKGYPVLAFHKKSDGSYLYIGRYNMLLDKGSDECFGFKPNSAVKAKLLGEKKVRDIAECWEFSNNARGYCSFRDPWVRKTLSFRPPEELGGTPGISGNGYTSKGAPLVADSYEYRYHKQKDALDVIYNLKEATLKQYQEDLGMDAIDPVAATEKFYKWHENWEKACQWVWSTCIDDSVCTALKVPHQGNYIETVVGKKAWETGKFYILVDGVDDEGNPKSEYVIDNSSEWNPAITYYEIVDLKNESGTVVGQTYANAYASNYVYAKGVYYTIVDESYILDRGDEINESATYYRLDEYTEEQLAEMAARGEVEALAEPVTYGTKTYKYDTIEYRVDKFVYELDKHFDIDYLATYFVMTEVFECYDSRGKNCMMASWGPHVEGGDYIWYPIFYDIDTQLGINNTGIPSFEYSVDATEAGNYSTSDSVLWNNFYKNFRNSYILQKYRQLKGLTSTTFNSLAVPILDSVERIEKWYQADPDECNMLAMRGQRPLIAINLDEYYKYLNIYNNKGANKTSPLYGLTGRLSDQGIWVTETTDYLYALQGNRSLSRIQFLSNRMEYIDSWLNVGNYARGGYNRLWGRVQANNGMISDYWLDSTEDPYFDENGNKRHEFDAEFWMTLTPIHDSYITLSDDNEAYPSQKFSGSPVQFEISALKNGFMRSKGYPEQLLYVYGMNQMKDIGDLSKLYWTEFKIEGEAKKLTKLKLGHDGYMTNLNNEYVDQSGNVIAASELSEKGVRWFNNKMNPPSIPSSANDTGMPLLKEMNVCNITVNSAVGTPALDLTSCEKLQNFRATGTNFEDIQFAEGVALHTLYLPNTIKSLKLTEAKLLTKIIENYQTPVKNSSGDLVAEPGLYVQGLTDIPDDQLTQGTSAINTISFVGDALGYDSYKILYKYYKLRKSKTTGNTGITMTDVKWSPYTLLVEGDVYVPADRSKYFVDTGHYALRAITDEDINNFNNMVLNGEIYKKDTSISDSKISLVADADMFFDMITDTKFVSATGAANPNITGIIYVNNTTAVKEIDIRTKLVAAYPKVTFFFNEVEEAYSAKFVLPDLDPVTEEYLGTYSYVPNAKGTDELSIQKITEGWFTNPYDAKDGYLPKKPNYDFLGWSTTTDRSGLISSVNDSADEQKNKWNAQVLDPDKKDYVFYAIFTIHKYHIEFYAGPNKILEQDIPYGDMLSDPGLVPSYTDSSLADDEKYRFLGYTQNENQLIVTSENAAKTVNLNTMMSVQDYKFYATFIKESVYSSPLDNSYFTFAQEDHGSIDGGYYIYPAEGVQFSGKITLPSTYNNQPIVGIGGFYNQPNVTHIYWHGTPQLQIILANCFGNDNTSLVAQNLEVFQIPNTVRFIGNRAFSNCQKLKPVDLSNTALEQIGNYAFFGAMAMSTKHPKFKIPGSVTKIGDFGIGNMKLPIGTLAIGGPGEPTQLPDVGGLGTKAIWANSFGPIDKIEIYGSTDEIVQGWISSGSLISAGSNVKEVQRIDA